MAAVAQEREAALPTFMSVRQVSQYLQLNEKKVYALLKEGKIPGTKITGKWLFPRELIDRWMLDSSHGGLLTDRLVVSGSDDPLLYRAILGLAGRINARALVSYSPTGTRLGLELLQAHRTDTCGIHWGPEQESHLRHPALLRQYPQCRNWVLVRAFRRRQGLLLSPGQGMGDGGPEAVIEASLRDRVPWAMRQEGAGAQRFVLDALARCGTDARRLHTTHTALSEREAAAAVAMGRARVAPGAQAAATEFGLDFVPLGWEAFDLVLPRNIYFRRLFQDLVDHLKSGEIAAVAEALQGYDLGPCGQLIWSDG